MTELRNRQHKSVPASHFDTLYKNQSDPWDYRSSPFEARKRAATIDALGQNTFERALELGCSIGILTEALAGHASTLVGVDGSALACEQARARLAHLQHVRIVQARFPEDRQRLDTLGPFDLIVLSEVLYFFSSEDMAVLADYVGSALTGGGLCLVVNFDGETCAGFSGLEASALFADLTAEHLEPVRFETCTGFKIEMYRRRTDGEMRS
jgi:predicted TPR repeat methyltransferase